VRPQFPYDPYDGDDHTKYDDDLQHPLPLPTAYDLLQNNVRRIGIDQISLRSADALFAEIISALDRLPTVASSAAVN
jgi:hypothetical protein